MSRFAVCLVAFLVAGRATAQQGLPVESELVRTACGGCHQPDERGVMTRISFQRKTPEGWQETLKRMVRLEYVSLEPEQARAVVRYLSDGHGLAPEEARPVFYEAEKRPIRREPLPDDENFKEVCTGCHVAARALAQRRTKEEWTLLKGMHLGYFPRAPFLGEPEPPSAEDDEEDRADRALAFLAQHYEYDSPEWRSFQAKRTEIDLSGRWLFKTYLPGAGLAVGTLHFEKVGDDYRTEAAIRLPDGSTENREGRGILYTGYSWRGTSRGQALGEQREVLMLDDDGQKLTGRFYRGAFGDLGIDVEIARLGSDPLVAGISPRSLRVDATEAPVAILGSNFPDRVSPADIALGAGVRVTEIVSRSASLLEARVRVESSAAPGERNVSVGGVTAVNAFAVYDRIDYIRVRPEDELSRLGGVRTPKQLIQFEAVAYHRGVDDEPGTEDDMDLGPVPAEWSLEEYHIRHDDDDVRFVGSIDGEGLFTPNVDGPNAERGTNNAGDVWVVASHTPPGAKRPLRGRAHLVVTVPIYTLWDFFPGETSR